MLSCQHWSSFLRGEHYAPYDLARRRHCRSRSGPREYPYGLGRTRWPVADRRWRQHLPAAAARQPRPAQAAGGISDTLAYRSYQWPAGADLSTQAGRLPAIVTNLWQRADPKTDAAYSRCLWARATQGGYRLGHGRQRRRSAAARRGL